MHSKLLYSTVMAPMSFGKGPEQPPEPTRVSDNLRSQDSVEVLLGLGEGPWSKLHDGLKSFYIANTPLMASDGTLNFPQANLIFHKGTSIPDPVQFHLGGSASGHPVGVNLSQNSAVTRTTTSGDIDAIDVRLRIDQLMLNTEDGDQLNEDLLFRIEVKPTSSGTWQSLPPNTGWLQSWTAPDVENSTEGIFSTIRQRVAQIQADQQVTEYQAQVQAWQEYQDNVDGPIDPSLGVQAYSENIRVYGRTQSPVMKEIRIPVTRLISDTYDIRVTKISAESTSTSIREITWDAFEQITIEDKSYPNTVMAQLLVQASDQLSSVPQMYGVYDTAEILVPSIFDPETRSYDFSGGPWDGTFKVAFTDDLAWVIYDLVHNDVHGIAAYHSINFSKYEALEASLYWNACDLVTGAYVGVPRPSGGTRPRVTFNGLIDSPRNSMELLTYMAGAGNAVFYEDVEGNFRLKVETDTPSTQTFNNMDVENGRFQYSFSDINTRYNDITVVYRNKKLPAYQEDRRRVYDQADIDANGRKPLTFVAVGCVDTDEAISRAYHKLITSLTETRNVAFTTTRMGAYVEPHDIILIADEAMDEGHSRRCVGISSDHRTLTYNEPLVFEVNINDYYLNIQTASGVWTGRVSGNSIYTTPNTVRLTADSAIPQEILDTLDDNFSFSISSATQGDLRPYRVTSIEEAEGERIKISAIEVNRAKYDLIDAFDGEIFNDDDIDESEAPSTVITELQSTVTERVTSDGKVKDIELIWDAPDNNLIGRVYLIRHSYNDLPATIIARSTDRIFRITDAPIGTHVFSITTLNADGTESPVGQRARVTTLPPDYGLPSVTGVTIQNKKDSSTTYLGRNAYIEWSVDTSERWAGWESDKPHPDFSWYEIDIVDPTIGSIVHTYKVYNWGTKNLEIPYSELINFGLSDIRDFSVVVSVSDLLGNEGASFSRSIEKPVITLSNFNVSQVSDLSTRGSILFDEPADPDFVGLKIWVSNTANPETTGRVLWEGAGSPVIDFSDGLNYISYRVIDTLGLGTSVLTTFDADITSIQDFMDDADSNIEELFDALGSGTSAAQAAAEALNSQNAAQSSAQIAQSASDASEIAEAEAAAAALQAAQILTSTETAKDVTLATKLLVDEVLVDTQTARDLAETSASSAGASLATVETAKDVTLATKLLVDEVLVDTQTARDLALTHATSADASKVEAQASAAESQSIHTATLSNNLVRTTDGTNGIGNWKAASVSTDVPPSAPAGSSSLQLIDGAREVPSYSYNLAGRVLKVSAWIKTTGLNTHSLFRLRGGTTATGGTLVGPTIGSIPADTDWTFYEFTKVFSSNPADYWMPAFDLTSSRSSGDYLNAYDIKFEDITESYYAEQSALASATSQTAAAAKATESAQSAIAAETSNLLAATALTNATTQASSSAQSSQDAETSRAASEAAAINSATSETAAGQSATSAAGSASLASSKASEASQSAITSTQQALIAQTGAGEASVSSDQAAISETNALQAATTAVNSSNLAALSEGAASGYATSAQSSAAQASASNSASGNSATASESSRLKAEASALQSAAYTSGNMCWNPDVEDGDLDGWASPYITVIDDPIDGFTKTIKSSGRDLYFKGPQDGYFVRDNWGGRKIRAKGWFKSVGLYSARIGLHMVSTGGISVWPHQLAATASSNVWTFVDVVIPLQDNLTYTKLRPFIQSEGSGSGVEHDIRVVGLSWEDVTESENASIAAAASLQSEQSALASETAASQSASAADAAKLNAETAETNAQNAETNAVSAKNSAESAEANAASSATLSATASLEATDTVMLALPSRANNGDYFTEAVSGEPSTRVPLVNSIDTTHGAYIPISSVGHNTRIGPRGYIAHDPDVIYELTATYFVTDAGTQPSVALRLGFHSVDASYALEDNNIQGPTLYATVAEGLKTSTLLIGGYNTSARSNYRKVLSSDAKWIWPHIRQNAGVTDGQLGLYSLTIKDVTARINAADSASAAATSASQASASETDSSQSASAAENSKLNAETAESNAAASENSAATSASSAAGSAATATSQASLSAAAKTGAETAESNAQTSANAAATSASNAQAFESAAGQSASAAEISKLNAQTAESNADNFATDSANSATNSAGSAAQSSTAATQAASSENNSSNSASAAASSASQALSSATLAGQSASASEASNLSAEAFASDAEIAQTAATSNNLVRTTDGTNGIGNWKAASVSTDVPPSAPAGSSSLQLIDGARENPLYKTRLLGRVIKTSGWIKTTGVINAASFRLRGGSTSTSRALTGGSYGTISADTDWTYYEYYTEIPNEVADYWGPAFDLNTSGGGTSYIRVYDLRFEDVTESYYAAQSATAALSSEGVATAQATAASQSASAADTSKVQAQTAEAAAELAENSAAQSATNAQGSASAAYNSAALASTSEGNAQNSAASAATSATSATSQASNAGQSASAAETSSISAGVSQVQAASSASASAASASQASASETAAGQSATSAQNFNLNAETAAGSAAVSASQAAASEISATESSVAASESASISATLASGEMLAKSSFEDGNLTGWSRDRVSNTSSLSVETVTGLSNYTKALNIKARDTYYSPKVNSVSSSNPYVRTDWSERSFRIRGWVKNDGPYELKLGLHLRDINFANARWYTTQVLPANTGTWTYVDFIQSTGSQSIEFPHLWVFVQSNGSSSATDHNCYITGMSWEDVTESHAAGEQAAASVVSASQASASETAAGQYASSSLINATNAANSEASASTSASQSSTSAAQAAASETASSNNAVSSAGSASNSATSAAAANTSAVAAQTIYQLTSKIASNSVNLNSTFSDYTSGTIPPNWSKWNAGDGERVAGTISENAFKLTTAADTNGGIVTDVPAGVFSTGWWVIEAEFVLDSGTLEGSGILLQHRTASASLGNIHYAKFSTSRDSTGELIGQGVVGRRYRISKLLEVTDAAAINAKVFLRNFWTGFASTGAAKTITWHKCAVRAATTSEIDAGKVVDLEATVTQNSSVLSTVEGQLQARWGVGAAVAGAEAFIFAQADQTVGGNPYSTVGMGADLIALYNRDGAGEWIRAMRVSGGDVRISGNLEAGAGIYLGTGSGRWPVALQQRVYNQTDGAVITFGTGIDIGDYEVDFDALGLDELASGESYKLRAINKTGTGFTAELKITTTGATTMVTTDTNAPTTTGLDYALVKADSGIAYNDGYNFFISGSVSVVAFYDSEFGSFSGNLSEYYGGLTVVTWFHDGTSWVEGPTKFLDYHQLGINPTHTSGTLTYTFSNQFININYTGAIRTSATEGVFGVTATNGTLTALNKVVYTKQGSSGTRTATPNGELCKITVKPENQSAA